MIKIIQPVAILAAAVLAAVPAAQAATTNLPPWPITQVWGGGRHTMALLSDGSVWTWGSDVSGKLGDNQVTPSYTNTDHDSFLPLRVHGPGNVGYLASIIAISAGESHNLALKSDGTVWAWGWNGLGQLGNGTTNDAHTPVQVSGLSNVVAISGRGYHCLALKSDGTVWGWGWNSSGQLGNGSATNFITLPLQVIGLTNPAAISAGYTISLARMSNGTVRVWGTDRKGEMGQGVTGFYSYQPVQVPGLSNVISVSADFQEPEALKTDGTIWMWGWNNLGQLGDGTTTDTNVPTQVQNLTNMIFVGATGDRNNCAIGSDRTVWTWGRNYNGQLGIGTMDQDPHPLPVPVPAFGKAPVIMVQTPDWHSLALESDGTLWGWGANDHGQLGNSTTNDAYSPTPVLWPVVPASEITLNGSRKQADGSFLLSFTNNPGARFIILAASDLSLPFSNWMVLGSATEVASGQFQFTDTQATNWGQRYYRVRSP
jgi:alpha-tubulin suppressor-like RCC1 family protein